MAENDWVGWRDLTRKLGHRLQLVGDGLFVTHQPGHFPTGIGTIAR